MAELLLGPMLRHVGENDATVWVETSEPCEVEVLGCRAPTFSVERHHFALVVVDGLQAGETREYEVRLDGERRWPEADSRFPPSVIRTIEPGAEFGLTFGSCRVAMPNYPPYTLSKDDDERGLGEDALRVLALEMRDQPQEAWPRVMMLIGDQLYADNPSPSALEFIRSRRDVREGAGEEAADFEEYAYLYRDSWSEPEVRWLFSTISTSMIFDDHEIRDNWNGSILWIREREDEPWWDDKVSGALSTYWIYQHLGNLSPNELERDDLWPKLKGSTDAEAVGLLREMSLRVARDPEAYRWSFYRDIGGVRLIALDSRAGRKLEPGRRRMIHAADWDWVCGLSAGDFDHLLFVTSIPLLVGPGIHYAEAWNDALCDGAWGGRIARASERLREWQNLGHWSAFPKSFDRFVELLRSVSAGELGPAPASVAVLSGDVHHAYLARAAFPSNGSRENRTVSAVYQAVCSPFRNALDKGERRVMRFAWSKVGAWISRAIARAAGVKKAGISWSLTHPEPWFDNQVATLTISGRKARMRLEKTVPKDSGPHLETVFERDLAM